MAQYVTELPTRLAQVYGDKAGFSKCLAPSHFIHPQIFYGVIFFLDKLKVLREYGGLLRLIGTGLTANAQHVEKAATSHFLVEPQLTRAGQGRRGEWYLSI